MTDDESLRFLYKSVRPVVLSSISACVEVCLKQRYIKLVINLRQVSLPAKNMTENPKPLKQKYKHSKRRSGVTKMWINYVIMKNYNTYTSSILGSNIFNAGGFFFCITSGFRFKSIFSLILSVSLFICFLKELG